MSEVYPGQNVGRAMYLGVRSNGFGWAAAVRMVKHLIPTPTVQHMASYCYLTPDSDCQWCCRHCWEMGWNYYIYNIH